MLLVEIVTSWSLTNFHAVKQGKLYTIKLSNELSHYHQSYLKSNENNSMKASTQTDKQTKHQNGVHMYA